jgi:hypothetical protein
MLSLDAVDQCITSGSYQEMKRLHEKLQVLKTGIRMEQERLQKKRMVWRKAGVVGEFRYLRVYDYDRHGFNEFLYDLGILPRVSSIDHRLMTDEEKEELLPIQRTGKPTVR